MPRKKLQDATRRYERYWKESDDQVYVLRLYVTGATPASARAIANLKELCERRLKGRFQLEVIDIFQKPALAEGEQIIAAPTLVKVLPPPLRRFIGDLSDLEGKLLGLDLRPKGDPPKAPPQ
jgi:circadian clock protein KaiB